MALNYSFLPGRYGIYQYAADAVAPVVLNGFFSITRADNELSVVCLEGGCNDAIKAELGWVLMKLHGPFEFTAVGIIAEVSKVLARAKIPLFVLSTFDTDYILLKAAQQEEAIAALVAAGHTRPN